MRHFSAPSGLFPRYNGEEIVVNSEMNQQQVAAAPTDHQPGDNGLRSARVAAVVVMCHLTDARLLERLLHSVVPQVAGTFVIDNTPADMKNTSPILPPFRDRVCHIPLGENTGVPNAQNVGIEAAIKGGYTHVLLLDDDSALPPEMMQKLLAAEAYLRDKGELIAALGPAFVNEKTGEYSTAVRPSYILPKTFPLDSSSTTPVETDHLIASGSLIPADALKVVGLMRGDFFMDWFDIEWGLRAKKLGYKSFICPNVIMRHSIGDASAKVLWRSIPLHSDFRNYCILRNGMYLLRRSQSLGRQWKMVIILKIPKYIVFCPMHSKRPLYCFFLLLRGILDGWSGKLGNLEVR